jgi:phospholipid/cholesterol/gamma-HCH transport system substrate-binding protein
MGVLAVSRVLTRSQALVLGAVVLGGLALAGAGLFAVGSRHWPGSDTFRVAVGFEDVGGVEVGSRVRLQGMDAGEVEAIDLPESAGGPVTLRLRLAGRFRNLIGDPASARVEIGSEGLFGGKYVKIIPGRPGKGPVADEVTLRSQPAPELTRELSETAARLKHTLGELDAAIRSVRRGEGTLGQLVKNDTLYRELTGTVGRAKKTLAQADEAFRQVNGALRDLRGGKGSLGRLVKSQDAYREALRTVEQVREMVRSVKQNADALKSMPLVRSYVVDPHKLLNRPDRDMTRKWLPAKKLFRPGRAVLTARGRGELDRLAGWLQKHNQKGSEVVVASYAGPGLKMEAAQTLTQKRSEAVCAYLTERHKVHKTGWWWWSRRSVKPVGCGTMASPIPADARRKLPPARVEVLVFLPSS